MNQLERSIISGAVKAQKQYETMTGGWWLDHGPESFFQIIVAQQVCKLGHNVYVDATIKKLRDGRAQPGRPTKDLQKRPDLSVWNKSTDTLRAAIEIKRAWSFPPVRSDAKKLTRILGFKGAPKSGYLLVYTDHAGKTDRIGKEPIEIIKGRFDTWADELGWSLVGTTVEGGKNDNPAWGVGLLRRDA